MTPERQDACLLLCPRPLTVQLIMSSPGAPPPPLSPDGATEGTVRAKQHRCVNVSRQLARKSPSTCLESILDGTSQFIPSVPQIPAKTGLESDSSPSPPTACVDTPTQVYMCPQTSSSLADFCSLCNL